MVVRLIQTSLLMLASVSEVLAQSEVPAGAPGAVGGVPPEAPSLFGALMQMLPMLAICYLIFYFMVIRPQEAKNKQHKSLLESIKRGDTVVTTSGVIAKVAGVESDHVLLEVAPNVKVKYLMTAIARLDGGEAQKTKAA